MTPDHTAASGVTIPLPEAIDTLMFDLGGVIIDLSIDRAKSAFAALGMPDPDALLDPFVQKGPFARLESGAMTEDEFFAAIRQMLPVPRRAAATGEAITEAFCKFLKALPVSRLRALETLSTRYSICLLSNTNPLMWHTAIASFFRQDGHEREHYFPGGIVTSFEARVMKPDEAIFAYAVKHLSLDPGRTLFLDDGPANVTAARRCGFHALEVTPDIDFVTLLKSHHFWPGNV